MGNILAPVLGNLAYLLVPFSAANYVDITFILIAVIWSIIVEFTELKIPWNYDDNNFIIGILSGTLGFLLSLNLSKYMETNRTGLALFETLTGNCQVVAWKVNAMAEELPDNEADDIDIVDDDHDSVILKYKLITNAVSTPKIVTFLIVSLLQK